MFMIFTLFYNVKKVLGTYCIHTSHNNVQQLHFRSTDRYHINVMISVVKNAGLSELQIIARIEYLLPSDNTIFLLK